MTTTRSVCAVEDCDRWASPWGRCPYDGGYHHHGLIHYENDHPAHPHLRFRPGGWLRVCAKHYAEIEAALAVRP